MTIVRPPQARTIAASLQGVSTIEKQSRGDGIGTLNFGESSGFGFANRQQNWGGLKLGLGIPVFVGIDNVAEVFAMAQKIRSGDNSGR